MDTSPLSIILVENGSKGDRLLFRYPYDVQNNISKPQRAKLKRNPYSISATEDLYKTLVPLSVTARGSVHSFPSKVLSNLFAVKPELCGSKFELKINDIRFVGHPYLQYQLGEQRQKGLDDNSIFSFNIVFALKASASVSVVNCYHMISQHLGAALKHEERRCGYLSQEAKIMTSAQDEVACHPDEITESPFHIILQRSQLARDLKTVFEDLVGSGVVRLRVNKSILVSSCVPQKVYHLHDPGLLVEPASIAACIRALRPYHTVLLLEEKDDLISSLPVDASPALIRIISMAKSNRSLQMLAADTDLVLSQVFHAVSHLLYWGRATVVYPLCDTNVYVLSPHANTSPHSKISERFSEAFPGRSLVQILTEFSFPVSLSQRRSPLCSSEEEAEQSHIIVWMLKYHLLIQLHTYVQLMAVDDPIGKGQHSQLKGRNKTTSEKSQGRVSFASRQSTPDELGSGTNLVRHPSDSDLASIISDDVLSSPSNRSSKDHWSASSLLPPSVLTAAEREAILRTEAASNTEDLELFARLCPYFRGKHHLEEIMFLENVRRSQLLHLLDKFRSVLVTYEYEDAACSTFCRRST